jgi:hypothetical protein
VLVLVPVLVLVLVMVVLVRMCPLPGRMTAPAKSKRVPSVKMMVSLTVVVVVA